MPANPRLEFQTLNPADAQGTSAELQREQATRLSVQARDTTTICSRAPKHERQGLRCTTAHQSATTTTTAAASNSSLKPTWVSSFCSGQFDQCARTPDVKPRVVSIVLLLHCVSRCCPPKSLPDSPTTSIATAAAVPLIELLGVLLLGLFLHVRVHAARCGVRAQRASE